MKKITKEQASKLLESAVSVLKEYETYTDPDSGVTTDDEGNVVSHGWRGGRHSTNGYNRRSAYVPRPTAAPTTPPTEDENAVAQRIANAIAKKKGLPSADQGLVNWVLKQRAAGKLGGKAPAAAPAVPPVAESMLENEVKSEILEAASVMLEKAKKIKEAFGKKKLTPAEAEKKNDIRKDQGKPVYAKPSYSKKK
jgi:hypothetical protein